MQAVACHVTFQKVCAPDMFAYVIHCSKHDKLHYGSQIVVVKINFDYLRSGQLQLSARIKIIILLHDKSCQIIPRCHG